MKIPTDISAELFADLAQTLTDCWERGWQPADVMRLVGRHRSKAAADVLRRGIARQAAEYEQWGAAVAPEWMGQLDEIGAVPSAGPPFDEWTSVGELLVAGREALSELRMLPALPRLMPPPSAWPGLGGPRPGNIPRLDAGLLTKIRALLAKAEATEFEAEAETFTAKAQELMTRHRIDRAALETERDSHGEAIGRRIGLERPYEQAKSILLGGIALANSCRAVWSKGFGFATVFGHPEDIESVEELYTSLLVQATSALRRPSAKRGRAAGDVRRYRRSFLLGFAFRISERLRDATETTVRTMEHESGRDLVPILTSRERAAEAAMNEMHSRLRGMSVTIGDGDGYRAGTRFADRADLRTGWERLSSAG